jgi:hypothetical protein
VLESKVEMARRGEASPDDGSKENGRMQKPDWPNEKSRQPDTASVVVKGLFDLHTPDSTHKPEAPMIWLESSCTTWREESLA